MILWNRLLLKAKHLVWQLGHLRIPQEKMDSLIVGQFSVASSSNDLQWIRAIRKEATLIYSDNWIDEHLPSPDGKKKSSKFKKSSFKTPSVSMDSSERSGMCKDVQKKKTVSSSATATHSSAEMAASSSSSLAICAASSSSHQSAPSQGKSAPSVIPLVSFGTAIPSSLASSPSSYQVIN